MDDLIQPLLAEAEADANVIGVLLKGSRAAGTHDEESDWDLVVVTRDGEPSHRKDGAVDVLRTTLQRLRAAPAYELPAIAHAEVLLDKTGELTQAIEDAGRVGRAELAELYDSYLNDFYRSLKAWRRGRELAARIKAVRSLWWLGEFLCSVSTERARRIRAPGPAGSASSSRSCSRSHGRPTRARSRSSSVASRSSRPRAAAVTSTTRGTARSTA